MERGGAIIRFNVYNYRAVLLICHSIQEKASENTMSHANLSHYLAFFPALPLEEVMLFFAS